MSEREVITTGRSNKTARKFLVLKTAASSSFHAILLRMRDHRPLFNSKISSSSSCLVCTVFMLITVMMQKRRIGDGEQKRRIGKRKRPEGERPDFMVKRRLHLREWEIFPRWEMSAWIKNKVFCATGERKNICWEEKAREEEMMMKIEWENETTMTWAGEEWREREKREREKKVSTRYQIHVTSPQLPLPSTSWCGEKRMRGREREEDLETTTQMIYNRMSITKTAAASSERRFLETGRETEQWVRDGSRFEGERERVVASTIRCKSSLFPSTKERKKRDKE